MVINAPNTEVHLITGEIGICSLLTGQRGHFELPRVSYQTSKGNVVLFPDEIMPVDINLLQQEINEGYIMLSDGRYFTTERNGTTMLQRFRYKGWLR